MTKKEIGELKLKVKVLGEKGMGSTAIQKLGLCSRQAASRYLKEFNLNIDHRGGKNAKISNNPFLPRTSESDYWLGMILADGNVSTLKHSIRLSQAGANKNHMLKYHKFLKYKPVLYEYRDKNMYLIAFGHRPTSDWIISIGITPAKASTVKLNIPFNWDIVRGYFDGDGGFIKSGRKKSKYFSAKFTSSSIILLQQLQEFLINHKIASRLFSEISKKYGSTIYRLTIRGSSKYDFCTKMYENATVYMDRKKKMWDNYAQVNKVNCLGTPEEGNQQPSLGSNTFEGSTTNDRIQTDNAADSNIDTSALPLTNC